MGFFRNIIHNLRNPKKIVPSSGSILYRDPSWREKHYRGHYLTAQIKKAPPASILHTMTESRHRYQAIADAFNSKHLGTRLYWLDIAVIHALEGSCDFSTCLHNGESLASVNVHGTRLVPAGRGKGKKWTWDEAALDALECELISGKAFPRSMKIEDHLYFLEQYNGTGYLRHHPETLSPYLWSYTNKYTSGKYVADGKWHANAVSQQCGAVTYYITLDQFALI